MSLINSFLLNVSEFLDDRECNFIVEDTNFSDNIF